jgi:hypothetical protein
MKNATLDSYSDIELIEAVTRFGGVNKAAIGLGVPKTTFKDRYAKIVKVAYPAKVNVDVKDYPVSYRTPTTFILTSAQNNTDVHVGFLRNLEAYAKDLNATIMVAGYTYSKVLFGDPDKTHAEYHPSVQPYLVNTQCALGNSVLFCAEMNTLPTAVDPLSGFEAYTRSKWGVFPHPRISLKSIPTMFGAPPKQIMTTGSITLPNYVNRKAGLKAEFHHVIGAVLVEIDVDGAFFCRHLIAEKDGSFQDLDAYVCEGTILRGANVEAITWGDIHAEKLDKKVALGSWGIDNKTFERVVTDEVEVMYDVLQPDYQFFHDVLDFHRRNHHNIGDPYHRFRMYSRGTESVREELENVGKFLLAVSRPECRNIVIDSNHDRALVRWLRTADYRSDPVNALIFLELQLAMYTAIDNGTPKFSPLRYFVEKNYHVPVEFLTLSDSFVICSHAGGGIECALHGDKGANGAKGHVNSFARMGPKANTADKHAAEIFEGIYQAGHSCSYNMGYNVGGLSSWSPSHIVTYTSGKRAIVTMYGHKFRVKRG